MLEEGASREVEVMVGVMAENEPGLKGTMELSGEMRSASSTVGGRNGRSTPWRRWFTPLVPV